MSHIYRDSMWGKVDLSKCREAVHDDYGFGFHQCIRKPKVFTVKGVGFCTQHAKMRGLIATSPETGGSK